MTEPNEMTAQDLKNFSDTITGAAGEDNIAVSEQVGDHRDRRPTYDINKVDYKWVDKETNKKELRLAYEALKEDAGFPDLTRYVLKKLKQVNPNYKTSEDFNNYTPEEARQANDDVLDFLDKMNEADNKLRGGDSSRSSNIPTSLKGVINSNIFGENPTKDKQESNEPSAQQLEYAA